MLPLRKTAYFLTEKVVTITEIIMQSFNNRQAFKVIASVLKRLVDIAVFLKKYMHLFSRNLLNLKAHFAYIISFVNVKLQQFWT